MGIDKWWYEQDQKQIEKGKQKLFAGTNKYNCGTCDKRRTCKDDWDENTVCGFWFNKDSKVQGIGYLNKDLADELPLFQ